MVVIQAENIPIPTIEAFITPMATAPIETTPMGTIPMLTIPMGTIPMEMNPSGAMPNAIFFGLLPQCEGPSITVSYTHLRAPRDGLLSRMPSSA